MSLKAKEGYLSRTPEFEESVYYGVTQAESWKYRNLSPAQKKRYYPPTDTANNFINSLCNKYNLNRHWIIKEYNKIPLNCTIEEFLLIP